MGSTTQFTPNRNSPEINLENLVKACREAKVFGEDIDWDSIRWDITESLSIPGETSKRSLWWANNENDTWNRSGVNMLFKQPFCDFARAFICSEHADKKLKHGYVHRMAALRVLERAMVESTSEAKVARLNGAIFNRALQIAVAKYKRPIDCQSALENIARFLNEKHLVASSFSWKGGVRSSHSSTSMDKQEQEARLGKLPSKAALCALGEIFHESKVPADQVITSEPLAKRIFGAFVAREHLIFLANFQKRASQLSCINV